VPGADDGLLHQIGRIFGDGKALLSRREQHDAARDTELQGRGRVAVHKGFFDRRLVRAEALDNGRDLAEQRDKPYSQRLSGRGMRYAIGDVGQVIAGHIDDPPTGMPQPGIEPQNTHLGFRVWCGRCQAPSRAITSSATSKLA